MHESSALCEQLYSDGGTQIKIVPTSSWRERTVSLRRKTCESGLVTKRCAELTELGTLMTSYSLNAFTRYPKMKSTSIGSV